MAFPDRTITVQVTPAEAEELERMRLSHEWRDGYRRGLHDAANAALGYIPDGERATYSELIQSLSCKP